ncbi:MAG: inorganic diphosphatase, partial [Clostridia bacterium]|nr:inorganic diphosphatase [Clostridia bacterium]
MKSGIIGRVATVVVDRPLGSCHPDYPDTVYPINYGFIPDVMGGDGEAQDAYVLGVDQPLSTYTGRVIAVIHRLDDCEDKWVVAPDGLSFSREEILKATAFTERFFKIRI